MNTRHKWTSDTNEVLLTNAENVDKKGFDGYYADPVPEEKE
jgi:endo-alpha-1,4-polygalactosaminidase (GH114 family)